MSDMDDGDSANDGEDLLSSSYHNPNYNLTETMVRGREAAEDTTEECEGDGSTAELDSMDDDDDDDLDDLDDMDSDGESSRSSSRLVSIDTVESSASDDGCNDTHLFEDIHTGTFTRRPSAKSRSSYRHMDASVMGVDVNGAPAQDGLLPRLTSTSSSDPEGHQLAARTKNVNLQSGDSADRYVDHFQNLSSSHRRRGGDSSHVKGASSDRKEHSEKAPEKLPPGWQKHEDELGPYYWHVKTGVIQRSLPTEDVSRSSDVITARREALKDVLNSDDTTIDVTSMVSKATSPMSPLTDFGFQAFPRNRNTDYRWTSSSSKSTPDSPEKTLLGDLKLPIRFAVRSLGWVELSEGDLSVEKSSQAVNRCIVQLTRGHRGAGHDILDTVGRWGDGKDLLMEIDEKNVVLVSPLDHSVLNCQPVCSIRVWGVGRDNSRDFAYVARDKSSKKHMCHVFRSDGTARTIANTLRDICKAQMLEKQEALSQANGGDRLTRPTQLSLGAAGSLNTRHEHRPNRSRHSSAQIPFTSFPTPMEEPKKMIKAHFIGEKDVSKPSGIDTLNAAIDQLLVSTSRDHWQFVHVAVAPSTITVLNPLAPPDEQTMFECRLRYLSFLGIGRDVRTCAFIVDAAGSNFVCYVFHCEPSAVALSKTIEAACKLRYQKCLDAQSNRERRNRRQNADEKQQQSTASTFTTAIKSMFGQLAGRVMKT